MWNPDWHDAEPSFRESIADPGTEPDAGPLVSIRISKSWQAILAGCALQVCQPATWDVSDPVALQDVLYRSLKLWEIVASAGPGVIVEDGNVSITILAGDGTASAAITFTGSYTAAPNILVSCNDIHLGATFSDVTTIGCTVHLTADAEVLTDTTGTVTWAALA